MANEPADITQLLVAWKEGDEDALEQLMPLVENELRKIARGYMRKENPGHTLQATALVNEAYLKLIKQKRAKWKSRRHFFAIAAKCMQRILMDHAKAKLRQKRGGDQRKVSLSEAGILSNKHAGEIIALNEALEKLEKLDPRKVDVALLRHVWGFTSEKTAKELGISKATADRDWEFAKAWLTAHLRKS